jgi:hypothetical protein
MMKLPKMTASMNWVVASCIFTIASLFCSSLVSAQLLPPAPGAKTTNFNKFSCAVDDGGGGLLEFLLHGGGPPQFSSYAYKDKATSELQTLKLLCIDDLVRSRLLCGLVESNTDTERKTAFILDYELKTMTKVEFILPEDARFPPISTDYPIICK